MPETPTVRQTGAGLAAFGRAPRPGTPARGRPITPEDTARAAAFLASDDSAGMTGQVVAVPERRATTGGAETLGRGARRGRLVVGTARDAFRDAAREGRAPSHHSPRPGAGQTC